MQAMKVGVVTEAAGQEELKEMELLVVKRAAMKEMMMGRMQRLGWPQAQRTGGRS